MMRRQNTRSERHSRHPKDTALLETMEAALEDTADASDVEMHNDRCIYE